LADVFADCAGRLAAFFDEARGAFFGARLGRFFTRAAACFRLPAVFFAPADRRLAAAFVRAGFRRVAARFRAADGFLDELLALRLAMGDVLSEP
jgi:hypothetical protein